MAEFLRYRDAAATLALAAVLFALHLAVAYAALALVLTVGTVGLGAVEVFGSSGPPEAVVAFSGAAPSPGAVVVPPAWLAVGATVLALAAEYAYARRWVLDGVGATPLPESEAPDLHARVRRLAQQADLPAPDIAVVDARTPRSMAVGRAGDGTVVLTGGLLETLDGDELDAVLAHELAHLKNHDAAVMTTAAFLPLLVDSRAGLFDPVRERVRGRVRAALDRLPSAAARALVGGWRTAVLVASLAFFALVLLSVVTLVPLVFAVLAALFLLAVEFVGLVAVLSFSRVREYGADRAAARLVGPAALAGALAALDGRTSVMDMRARDGTLALSILPFERRDTLDRKGADLLLPSSHPPAERRIDRLRSLEREVPGSA